MKTIVHEPSLTPEIIAELEALERLPDDAIDLAEMPEWIDFSKAERGKFYRPVKQQVTLRLDADVIAWFKAHGGARGYQTRINAALRAVIEGERRKAG